MTSPWTAGSRRSSYRCGGSRVWTLSDGVEPSLLAHSWGLPAATLSPSPAGSGHASLQSCVSQACASVSSQSPLQSNASKLSPEPAPQNPSPPNTKRPCVRRLSAAESHRPPVRHAPQKGSCRSGLHGTRAAAAAHCRPSPCPAPPSPGQGGAHAGLSSRSRALVGGGRPELPAVAFRVYLWLPGGVLWDVLCE